MSGHKRGFTLLELLVAISIFGMVIGLAYSSYNATFHIINGATTQTATYSKAKIAMERIAEDLESFYPGESLIFKGSSDTIQGNRADTLQFTSTAHVQLQPGIPPMGHVIIHYQVKEDPDSDSLLLYRAEQQALGAETEETEETKDDPGLLLCDNLKEVAFDYRNKDGQDLESWGNDEEVTNASFLPTLISISLRFDDGEEDDLGTLFKTSLTLPVARK
jgi:prepilin-type N-terminal cleavage/methylation domain-containing protein